MRYLTCTGLYVVMPIFIYPSWTWTLHCNWDIWSPLCTFVAGGPAVHGYLATSSKFFVLILHEVVWCRAELSALHRVSRCWKVFLSERDTLENEHEVLGGFVNQKNIVEGSLDVKLPTIWTDEKHSRAEAQRREDIRREKSRRERIRRKKMQMREKVGKPRNAVFLQWFEAPQGRKLGSLKRRVRSQLARWEMKNCMPLWREE